MTESAKLPRQIPFIIGNEACERFSFYGMRNILTIFLIDYLLKNDIPDVTQRTAVAKTMFHDFVVGVYLFPMLGGYLADRYLGKYRTVLYLSIVYCLGHACLAMFESKPAGFYTGLFLIALGSGGIKPCVASLVGDQFTAQNKHLATKVFGAFYWSINFGSLFASLLMPLTLAKWGPSWAFGIPGVLMFIATVIFWLGRHLYVREPPTGKKEHGFFQVLWTAFKNRSSRAGTFLDGALARHPKEAVEATRAVLRVLLVFTPIPFFWALFDQKASTWVVQAKSMDPNVGGLIFQPSQMQFINPALVMMLIPLMTGIIYPLFKKWGFELTPLRRMTLGMGVASLSWVAAGMVQVPLDRGEALNIIWQLGPYVLLTTAEVLVSTTGLEFAYSQAPVQMKGTLMAAWNLTTAIGNLVVARASSVLVVTGASLFFTYAGVAAVAGVALAFIARSYRPVDYFRTA